MGDPASHRISRVRQYSRSCRISSLSLPLRDSHPLRSSVPATFGFRQLRDDLPAGRSRHLVQPHPSSGGSLVTLVWFGLFPVRSPLLRESSLFLGVREMFQFPRFPPGHTPGSLVSPRGVAPFGHLRIAGCQRLPGAFRRVATSFIGLLRQGIHHVPICGSSCSVLVSPPGSCDPCGLFVVRAMTSVISHTAGASQWSRLFACQCASRHVRGGAAGIRTPDLRLAKAALSQLSYGPPIASTGPPSVGAPGLEPGTSALSGLRSNQLSYAPVGRDWSSPAPGSPGAEDGAVPGLPLHLHRVRHANQPLPDLLALLPGRVRLSPAPAPKLGPQPIASSSLA